MRVRQPRRWPFPRRPLALRRGLGVRNWLWARRLLWLIGCSATDGLRFIRRRGVYFGIRLRAKWFVQPFSCFGTRPRGFVCGSSEPGTDGGRDHGLGEDDILGVLHPGQDQVIQRRRTGRVVIVLGSGGVPDVLLDGVAANPGGFE